MNWELVFTILMVGIAVSIVVAILGSVIVALQMAKFNAIRKSLEESTFDICELTERDYK